MHHVRIFAPPICPYSNWYSCATDRYANFAPYQGFWRHRLKVALLCCCYRCEFDLRRHHLAQAAINRYVGSGALFVDLERQLIAARITNRSGTSNALGLNIGFVIAYTACAYNFYRAITLDPGYSKLPKDEEELHSVRVAAFCMCAKSLTFVLCDTARGRSCGKGEVERNRVLHQLHGKPTTPDIGGLPPLTGFLPFRRSSPSEPNIAACAIDVSPDSISQYRRYFFQPISLTLFVIATVHGYGTVVCLILAPSRLEDADPTLSSVGSGNHRQFLLFVATLVAGISLFDALTVSCECSSDIERSVAEH